jgi:hypothetical protein
VGQEVNADPRDSAIEESIRKDREQREFSGSVQLRSELREARAKAAALERELDEANQRLGVALALGEPRKALPPVGAPKNIKHRGAFVLLCSDWHVGERVDPAQVGGRNEYNPDIAQRRVKDLIEGALWMIESWRDKGGYGWGIDQVVLWLGGDLMTGFIHEDLAESNFLSPTEEVLFAQDLCLQVIESISRHPGIKRVEVPTSWGNHGRTTPDRRINTAWKQSYEWMLYQQIAKVYAGSDKVVVHAGKDEISRLKVLNTTLGFNHGDQFRYMDGVGGLTIPGLKWLAKINGTEPVDVMNIGHHHTYVDLGRLVVNNCLIGWGPFSQRVAPFSRPSQVSYLIDEQHGKRMSTEIFVR